MPGDPKLPLRIIVTQKDCRDKYVALSRCWGGEVPSKTNSENIESRQTQGFESESLPKSFQDAVILTRELGFTYLWIDALCIIQDNNEDWAQESALMTQVYHNAILMISASASPSSSSGILKRMNYFQSSRFGSENESLWQSPSTIQSLEAIDKHEPLGRRAWSYQEKIMAKRILYFQEQQMAWGCSHCIHTESRGATLPWRDPWSSPFIGWKSKVLLAAGDIHTLMRRKSPDINPNHPDWNSLRPRLACWYKCVQEYAHRELTYESDKLPALSGLAHGLCVPELKEYLAGLWEVDLFRGLSWRYADRDKVAVEEYARYVAPSWSCMSARGKVMFYEDLSFHERPSEPRWEREWKPRLISHHVELGTSDPHGKITNGYILIQAYSRKILVHRQLRWKRSPWIYDNTLSYDKREGGFTWRFDTTDGYLRPPVGLENIPDERWPDGGGVVEEYVAVQIHNYPDGNGSGHDLVLLILDQVDQDGEKVYQRVGILSTGLDHKQKYNDRWQRQDFKII